MCVIISVVILFIGVPVIIGRPPFVIINDKLHFAFSKELNLFYYDEEPYTNEDVDSIKHLKWVKSIHIEGNQITDFSFLNEMEYVEEITFGGNTEEVDLTPLNSCKKLTNFCGGNFNLSDLSAFKELVNLKELSIEIIYGVIENENSHINDISDVKYLINLESFAVCGKNITDISALKDLKNLKSLSIAGTSIDNIYAIGDLSNLEYLSLSGNKDLKEISIIKKLTNLQNLSLRNTNLTNYSVVLELPNLKTLYIDEGVLTDKELRILKEKGVNVIE